MEPNIKNRVELANYFRNNNFNLGAEVGVLGGKYSKILCEANPYLKLYCVDSWGLGSNKYKKYYAKKYEEAKTRLADYNVTLIRKLSLDALGDFDNESLDFVYIDANHSFDYVMKDIIEWTRKVRIDGIVAGHDYINTNRAGVKDAVDMYVKHHYYKLNITLEEDEFGLSWWFRKKYGNS